MPEAARTMTTPRPTPHARSALALMLPWLILAVVVGVLDQVTKQLVLANLYRGEVIPVTGFFDLVLVFNTGAAFSFLAEHGGWQRWFFTVLALGISAWLLALMHHHRHEKLLPAAFALIIGGALGNVYDRIVHGANDRAVKALTLRIALSVAIFALLLLGYRFGVIPGYVA